ncbi:MAG: helicase C-terminal domain-containing protein [Myxococcota bacterium]|nr:helicase C-terminal domain-containing protein [Myxococcota bacterium]
MLEAVAPTNAIVFCNRRMEVDLVANFLRRQFWNCTPIHGDMPQKARERALESVRGGRSRLLIATDVAARGIDIRGLDAVFHFDLPQDAELYVHRAGRTGRIGASGLSAVLLTRSGGIKTQAIKARYAVTFEEANMPDKETSVAAQAERVIADLTAAGADLPLEQFMDLAQGISESPDAAQAIAYLLFEQTKRQKSTSSRDRDRKRDQEPSPRTGSGLTRYIIDGYEGDEAPEVAPIAEALGLDAAIVTVEASRRGGWLANIPRDTEAPGRAELTLGEFEVAIRRMKPPGRDRQRRRR